MSQLTVRDLRAALEEVPDDIPVVLSSDSRVDQGSGEVRIDKFTYVDHKSYQTGSTVRYSSINEQEYDDKEDM